MFNQDLHIHTVFSHTDSSIVPEQTPELIAQVQHARVIGISDHWEALTANFEVYQQTLRQYGLYVGTEVDGGESVKEALKVHPDYYIYHCRDSEMDYKGVELLLTKQQPVIIAHPLMLETDLKRIPPECLIEINNRYVWRGFWKEKLKDAVSRFRFVLSSDAHQPNWLSQAVSGYVARELGVEETVLFEPNAVVHDRSFL